MSASCSHSDFTVQKFLGLFLLLLCIILHLLTLNSAYYFINIFTLHFYYCQLKIFTVVIVLGTLNNFVAAEDRHP